MVQMGIARFVADQRARPEALANFDSSTSMVRALASALHGEPFPMLGLVPPQSGPLASAMNYLPRSVRRSLYQKGSAREGYPPDEMGSIDMDDIRQWVVDRYPARGYPAVVIGSANGALIHLAALLGIPWLPQTFLLPVRRSVDPDDPRSDLEASRAPGAALTDANDDITIHQMNDPNQDRLPVPEMAYFRVKLRRLGRPYREFLDTVLAPGGHLIISDCSMTWPSTKVSDRHFFQFGCIGGFTETDYYEGSPQIRHFLAQQDSSVETWDPPPPDGRRSEAEWGFHEPLSEDIDAVASETGYQVRRLRYSHPRDMGPLVARFYRQQYAKHGLASNRLLINTFTQIDPWWTLRTGTVPLWLSFTSMDDRDAAQTFLDQMDDRFTEIYLTLFSHGVDSFGLANPIDWQPVLNRAHTRGEFLGMDPSAFPLDFSSYEGYSAGIPRQIKTRTPLIPSPSVSEVEQFITDSHTSSVTWNTVG